MEYVQANKQEPTEQNYIDLCVAVIKFAIREEGLGYLDTDGGQYWCDLAGINPDSLIAYHSSFRFVKLNVTPYVCEFLKRLVYVIL